MKRVAERWIKTSVRKKEEEKSTRKGEEEEKRWRHGEWTGQTGLKRK